MLWKDVFVPAVSALFATVVTLLAGEWSRARRLKQDTRLDYLTSQIRDFYGPLYSMIEAHTRIFESWNGGGPLQAVNDDVKKLFVSQNKQIERLILEKAHLIESDDDKIPEVIARLGTHVFIWNTCIERFGEVPKHIKDTVHEATWPADFVLHVKQTIAELRRELKLRTGSGKRPRPAA